ncbi:ComC/BlpC family leader-containing pheromone/bacteriocin [Streptococcus devriesei]|nr:ComC/BlpC family leader-containing pheromone/bacteriocin [Streptococcus devriesei]
MTSQALERFETMDANELAAVEGGFSWSDFWEISRVIGGPIRLPYPVL